MNIGIANSDAEIAACYSVMRELRPHLLSDQFISRVRNLERSGYKLAFVLVPEGLVAVAGFRISENLAWGHYMYIDDFVTHPDYRSRSYGSGLLSWLREYASKEGCLQLHLDSGVQRTEAHRFYEREGMALTCLHFTANTTSLTQR